MSTLSQNNSVKESAECTAPKKAFSREDYERFLPMIRRLAMRTVRKVPSHVTVNDLMGYAWLGLVEAYNRAPEGMPEGEFEAYASYRIRGAMLDYLRSLDPMARTMRAQSRQISRAISDLTKKHGRAPEEAEIAAELGLDGETYRERLSEVGRAGMARLEVLDIDKGDLAAANVPVDEELARQSTSEAVTSTIRTLPVRLQQVLALYYQEECTFREIGAVLGVTESRVCQLHSEAMHRLRAAIGKE